jgi:hypothetical protein
MASVNGTGYGQGLSVGGVMLYGRNVMPGLAAWDPFGLAGRLMVFKLGRWGEYRMVPCVMVELTARQET